MINKNIAIDDTTLKILFNKYKQFIFPVSVIAVCFILLLMLIIPQVGEYFSVEEEIKDLRNKNSQAKDNINFLTNFNQTFNNESLEIATSALPGEKDYVGIIQAVSNSSLASGVLINEFSFAVGNIAPQEGGGQNPTIRFSVNVAGGIGQVTNFIDSIYKSFPLAEVDNVEFSRAGAEISLLFYYKAIPNIVADYSRPIRPVSGQETAILDTLSSWR